MMKLLSGALDSILMPAIAIPGLILALVVTGHNYVKERDARITVATRNLCNASWEASIRKRAQDAAQQEVIAAQFMLEEERRISETLRNDLHTINSQNTELRFKLASTPAANPAECLSPGVLDVLRRRAGVVSGR